MSRYVSSHVQIPANVEADLGILLTEQEVRALDRLLSGIPHPIGSVASLKDKTERALKMLEARP